MIVEILASIVLGWFVVNFPLFKEIASDLRKILKIKEDIDNKYLDYISNLIFESIWNCYKCSTFWFSLLIFQNVLIAGSASLLIYILEKNNII